MEDASETGVAANRNGGDAGTCADASLNLSEPTDFVVPPLLIQRLITQPPTHFACASSPIYRPIRRVTPQLH